MECSWVAGLAALLVISGDAGGAGDDKHDMWNPVKSWGQQRNRITQDESREETSPYRVEMASSNNIRH